MNKFIHNISYHIIVRGAYYWHSIISTIMKSDNYKEYIMYFHLLLCSEIKISTIIDRTYNMHCVVKYIIICNDARL